MHQNNKTQQLSSLRNEKKLQLDKIQLRAVC